jgi:hypothetical protein
MATATKAQVVDSSTGSTSTALAKPKRSRKPAYKGKAIVGNAKTTFTPALGQSIIQSCREGMPFAFACHLHRVPQSTGATWLQKGEEDPTCTTGDFATDVRQAQAEFVQEAIEGIKRAGLNDARQWTALMTLLERIYPETFKRPSERGGDINIAVGVRLEDRLHKLHEENVIEYTGS